MKLDYKSLKSRHRKERENYHINLNLRVHRALSWLDKAENTTQDHDAKYIFLWIAFNAAYASEYDANSELSEQSVFDRFFTKICELDKSGLLYQLVWEEFTGSIRLLLNNKFIFKPFWEFCRGVISDKDWQLRFDESKKLANKALAQKNTTFILKLIFSRLYTLRNQMLHGGATWNSQTNRDQVRDGAAILTKLVPAIICIMMDNPDTLWGDPCYPVVE